MGKICLCCVLQPVSKYQLECQGGWWDGWGLQWEWGRIGYGVDVGGSVDQVNIDGMSHCRRFKMSALEKYNSNAAVFVN